MYICIEAVLLCYAFRMALLLLMMSTVKLSEEHLLLYQEITWLHTIWVVLNPRQVQFENVGIAWLHIVTCKQKYVYS